MASIAHLDVLFQELGPATDEVTEVFQDDSEHWSVVVHGETQIALELDSAQQKLILSTTLGAPSEQRRLETYELLLISNHARSQVGGITMALTGPQGHVVQMYELNTTELTLQILQTVLVSFAAKSHFWKEIVTLELAAPEFVPEDLSSLGNMLRI